MPELPDITLYIEALEARIRGQELERIRLLNRAVESMFGYSRSQLLRKPISTIIPGLQDIHERTSAGAAAWQQPRQSHSGRRKDGSEFPLEASISHAETRDGRLAIAFLTDITERKRLEQIEQNRKRLQQLSELLLEAREREAERIALELHDDFGQRLGTLGFELEQLISDLPRVKKTVQHSVQTLHGRIVDVADDMLGMARRLHPAILRELGLVPAVRSECHFYDKQGVTIELRLEHKFGRLPEKIELALFRIIQETLRNAMKHSRCQSCTVELQRLPGHVALQVEDNGTGFDLAQARKTGGLGLLGIEERVRELKGTFAIDTRPGIGTLVSVQLPLEEGRPAIS